MVIYDFDQSQRDRSVTGKAIQFFRNPDG